MVGVGIIGCGAIAQTHAKVVQTLDGAQLVACCDIDQTNGITFAERFSCIFHQDFNQLLAMKEIELVIICTPHDLHQSMSIAALEAQKHVLCEKPMAITLQTIQDLISTIEKQSKLYHVCYQNRLNPTYLLLKKQLVDNIYGKITGIKCELAWERTPDYYQSDWKGAWQREGGGVLINQAIHMIDAVTWLVGIPEKIKGKIMTACLDHVIEVEDTAMAIALYHDDTPLVIQATNNYTGNPSPKLTFECEKGQIELTAEQLLFNQEVILEDLPQHSTCISKKYWGRGHQAVLSAFINEINGQADERITSLAGVDALQSLKIVLGIYASSRGNNWISLNN